MAEVASSAGSVARWRRPGLVLLAGLVFLLLLGFATRPSGRRLDDGTYLRLLGVTAGSPQGNTHTFLFGERYQRPPFRWVPKRFRDHFGWHTIPVNVWVRDQASTLVWFTVYQPRARRLGPRTYASVELVDRAGTVLARGAQAPLDSMGQVAGLIQFAGFTNPPPDARLRVRGGVPARVLGEVQLSGLERR